MERENHKNTGLSEGKLNPCPDLPNCVCSQYPEDRSHYRQPWKYAGEREQMLRALKEVLYKDEHADVVEETANYIHVEFEVPLMGFTDDVEFLLPENEKVIHYRSASRVGTWDLGHNKRRMKGIRLMLKAARSGIM